MEARYNALIIDRNLDARMRLKQAMASVPIFNHVAQVGALFEVSGALCRFQRCDVIFISEDFADTETQSFIENAKNEAVTEDAAFVRVFREQKDANLAVAEQVMQGFDGVLFQPYSVNQLVEITRIAAKVKLERAESRKRLAISLLLAEFSRQLDLVATLKAFGCDQGKAQEKLTELAESLKQAGQSYEEDYQKLAIQFLEAIPAPPPRPAVKKYSGVSQRVRRRMVDKVAATIEDKAKNASGGA